MSSRKMASYFFLDFAYTLVIGLLVDSMLMFHRFDYRLTLIALILLAGLVNIIRYQFRFDKNPDAVIDSYAFALGMLTVSILAFVIWERLL